MNLLAIYISDDEDKDNTLYVIRVLVRNRGENGEEIGKFVYIKGWRGLRYPDEYFLSCKSQNGVIDEQVDEEYLSVRDYIKLMKKTYEETYFRIEGLIIQDGTYSDGTPIYKLYESEESYRNYKYDSILLEFSEEQHNINGKTVVILGKPDIFVTNSLVECSIVEE